MKKHIPISSSFNIENVFNKETIKNSLIEKIIEGEKSPKIINFDSQKNLEVLKTNYLKN